jgi:hypothetical protein
MSLFGASVGHGQSVAETNAAAALFGRYETVSYAKAALLEALELRAKNQSGDSTNDLELPYSELIEGLGAIGPHAEHDLEQGYGSVLAGARDFGGPVGIGPGRDGLGMVNSRKCYVAVRDDSGEPDVEQDFSQVPVMLIAGVRAWIWTIPSEGGAAKSVTFYAAPVANTYFVIANNESDFEAVVAALSSTRGQVNVSIDVPSWETFSKYDYWVYRMFRRTGVASPDAAGIKDLASDVTALTFFADVNKREGYVRILGSDLGAAGAPKMFRKLPSNLFQPQGAGQWQATIQFSKDSADADEMFELFYRLGFGVIV